MTIILNLDNDFFTNTFIDLEACSVGEILYSYFCNIDKAIIDKDIMLGLYIAVLTDTGSFRHSNTTEMSHKLQLTQLSLEIRYCKNISKNL